MNLDPADDVVVRLFQDIVNAKSYRPQDDEVKRFERQAWTYLMQYMCTLEVPEGI
jgi:hypothetical protein